MAGLRGIGIAASRARSRGPVARADNGRATACLSSGEAAPVHLSPWREQSHPETECRWRVCAGASCPVSSWASRQDAWQGPQVLAAEGRLWAPRSFHLSPRRSARGKCRGLGGSPGGEGDVTAEGEGAAGSPSPTPCKGSSLCSPRLACLHLSALMGWKLSFRNCVSNGPLCFHK